MDSDISKIACWCLDKKRKFLHGWNLESNSHFVIQLLHIFETETTLPWVLELTSNWIGLVIIFNSTRIKVTNGTYLQVISLKTCRQAHCQNKYLPLLWKIAFINQSTCYVLHSQTHQFIRPFKFKFFENNMQNLKKGMLRNCKDASKVRMILDIIEVPRSDLKIVWQCKNIKSIRIRFFPFPPFSLVRYIIDANINLCLKIIFDPEGDCNARSNALSKLFLQHPWEERGSMLLP